jgi:hypothetical protein
MDQLESVRAANGVRLVTEEQEGTSFAKLPPGVYGYTNSPMLADAPLYTKRIFRSFEIHKAVGGEGQVIFYVTPAIAHEIGSGRDFVECALYPEPHGEATEMVALPLRRVVGAKNPSRDEGNFIRAAVRSPEA